MVVLEETVGSGGFVGGSYMGKVNPGWRDGLDARNGHGGRGGLGGSDGLGGRDGLGA